MCSVFETGGVFFIRQKILDVGVFHMVGTGVVDLGNQQALIDFPPFSWLLDGVVSALVQHQTENKKRNENHK